MTKWLCVSVPRTTRTRLNLSLRGAEGRGNLDELDDAEHTSTNRRCHADEIATLRSQ